MPTTPTKKARPTPTAQLSVPAGAPQFFVEAIERTRAAKRPLVIDFSAKWCAVCMRLRRETLEHPDVAKALGPVEVIYVDLDRYPALGEAYGVAAIPDVFFVDGSGRIVDRLQKFETPEAFVARIQRVFAQPLNHDTADR